MSSEGYDNQSTKQKPWWRRAVQPVVQLTGGSNEDIRTSKLKRQIENAKLARLKA